MALLRICAPVLDTLKLIRKADKMVPMLTSSMRNRPDGLKWPVIALKHGMNLLLDIGSRMDPAPTECVARAGLRTSLALVRQC